MKSIVTFLFGSGWSTLWYACHYALLLPIWGFYSYFRDFKAGAGPQGGEAIFLFLIMFGVVVVGVGIVNALLVITSSGLTWWLRYLVVPLALVLVPLVAMFLGVAMADASTEPHFDATGKARIAVTLPVLILLCYGLNFWALATTRD
jgi:fatty acid desaturase